MTAELQKALLERFNGEPGVTQGLSNDEMLGLFQHLVTSGQIDTMDAGIKAHVAAWAEVGEIDGVTDAQIKSWLGFPS